MLVDPGEVRLGIPKFLRLWLPRGLRDSVGKLGRRQLECLGVLAGRDGPARYLVRLGGGLALVFVETGISR